MVVLPRLRPPLDLRAVALGKGSMADGEIMLTAGRCGGLQEGEDMFFAGWHGAFQDRGIFKT